MVLLPFSFYNYNGAAGGETAFPQGSVWANAEAGEKYSKEFSDCAKVSRLRRADGFKCAWEACWLPCCMCQCIRTVCKSATGTRLKNPHTHRATWRSSPGGGMHCCSGRHGRTAKPLTWLRCMRAVRWRREPNGRPRSGFTRRPSARCVLSLSLSM